MVLRVPGWTNRSLISFNERLSLNSTYLRILLYLYSNTKPASHCHSSNRKHSFASIGINTHILPFVQPTKASYISLIMSVLLYPTAQPPLCSHNYTPTPLTKYLTSILYYFPLTRIVSCCQLELISRAVISSRCRRIFLSDLFVESTSAMIRAS
jgi:hypothetical protein